jgi:hypothetical protein
MWPVITVTSCLVPCCSTRGLRHSGLQTVTGSSTACTVCGRGWFGNVSALYRDYLSADAATVETGRQVLGRILLRRSEDTSTPLERLNKLALANAAATSASAAGDPTRSVTEGSVHGLSSDARSLLGLRALDGVGQGLDAASQSAPGSAARSLYEDDESLAGRSLPSSYAPSGPLYGRMTGRTK